MRIIVITQARVSSTRLPRKVLKKLGDNTLLGVHLNRLRKSKKATEIVVATTMEPDSGLICQVAESHGLSCYKGNMNDVLDRFYQAAKLHDADWVVRVTSDCPLIDAVLLDAVVEMAISNDLDYCSNMLVEDYPDGQDVEVFKMTVLKQAWEESSEPYQREHVTPYIKNNSDFHGGLLFKALDYPCSENFNLIRMTVDEAKDLELMRWLVDSIGVDKTWLEYTNYILKNPSLIKNQDIQRNEGYKKSLNK